MSEGHFNREDLITAYEQKGAERFERAMREFLERNKTEDINPQVVDYVLENQARLRSVLEASEKAKNPSSLAIYNAAYYMIKSLPQTRSVMVAAGGTLTNYLPFQLGLVRLEGPRDERGDIFNISPTQEALELFNKCFPDTELNPRHVEVAIEGDLLGVEPRKKGARKKS